MKLIISSVSGEPIYEQIKTQIRSAVLGGELKAGEALPSLRKTRQGVAHLRTHRHQGVQRTGR